MSEMMQFNIAAPSAGALTVAMAMKVAALTTELQSRSLEEQAAIQQQEGAASIALGQATKDALDKQASATSDEAYGMIVGGGLQAGAETASVVVTTFGALDKNPLTGNKTDLGKLMDEKANLDQWETKLFSASNSQRGLAIDDGNGNNAFANARNRLRPNVVSEPLKDYEGDLDTILGRRENDPEGQNNQVIKDLKNAVSEQKKDVQRKIESSQAGMQQKSQRISTGGQIAGNTTQGISKKNAASEQADQALYELMKAANQYAYDSFRKAVDMTGQTSSMLGQQISATIQTLLAGVSRSNDIAA